MLRHRRIAASEQAGAQAWAADQLQAGRMVIGLAGHHHLADVLGG